MKYSRGVRRSRNSIRSRNRSRGGGSNGGKFFIWITTLVVVVSVVGLLWLLGKSLFSSIWAEHMAATIQITQGRAEFSLEGSSDWTRALSDQQFLAGDAIRTKANTVVSFELTDGYTFFINENSELQFRTLDKKSSGEKTIELDLVEGEIWAQVPEDKTLKDGSSVFIVYTDQLQLHVTGTIFDLVSRNNEDIIRLIRGNVEAKIYTNEDKSETKTLAVGVGQKLVITPQSKIRITAGEEVLEITDNNFLESDWHLNNLEKFAPEEAAQIRRKIEITQPKKPTPTDETEEIPTEEGVIESPKIISPENNKTYPASTDAIQIEGSSPPEAFQISVNGYTLTKFNPGDRKWTYFASKKFGTLVGGENTYEVVAIDRGGNKSAPAILKLNYAGKTAPRTRTSSANSLAAPVITKPARADASQPYQTSSEVVTIVGTVPAGTEWVTVNDFRLRKFQAGHTEFSYIANANYGNLKKGENIFKVTAYTDGGKKTSSSSIVVYYKPVDL